MLTTTQVHRINNSAGRGIDHLAGGPQHISGETKVMRHVYYQWVPFVLFFQAVLFYLPHYFWKAIESHRLKIMIEGLFVSISKASTK
jgi:hypothetical protein